MVLESGRTILLTRLNSVVPERRCRHRCWHPRRLKVHFLHLYPRLCQRVDIQPPTLPTPLPLRPITKLSPHQPQQRCRIHPASSRHIADDNDSDHEQAFYCGRGSSDEENDIGPATIVQNPRFTAAGASSSSGAGEKGGRGSLLIRGALGRDLCSLLLLLLLLRRLRFGSALRSVGMGY